MTTRTRRTVPLDARFAAQLQEIDRQIDAVSCGPEHHVRLTALWSQQAELWATAEIPAGAGVPYELMLRMVLDARDHARLKRDYWAGPDGATSRSQAGVRSGSQSLSCVAGISGPVRVPRMSYVSYVIH